MLLVEMHSVKTVVVTIYLLISTFVFIYNGQINWSYALVLSIGSGIGGWIGGRFAVNVSEKFLQTVLAVIVIALTLYLILDRKSTRLNSSHVAISYAVFCLKKKMN